MLRRRNKKNKVVSTLARSDVGIPSWTPCENGIVSIEMPKRKLTKVEDCLLTNGIAIDAIKCLNWKYMDTHPGKCPISHIIWLIWFDRTVSNWLFRPWMQRPLFEITFLVWKYGNGSTEMWKWNFDFWQSKFTHTNAYAKKVPGIQLFFLRKTKISSEEMERGRKIKRAKRHLTNLNRVKLPRLVSFIKNFWWGAS